MTAGSVNVPADRTLRDLTITVRLSGYGRFRARLWLGGWIIWLGARVAGFAGAVVTTAPEGTD